MNTRAPDDTATNAPMVSIIMPTYNGLLYLREAVESVRAQTPAKKFDTWISINWRVRLSRAKRKSKKSS